MTEVLLNPNEFAMAPCDDNQVHVFECLSDGVSKKPACHKENVKSRKGKLLPEDDNLLVCINCLKILNETIPGLLEQEECPTCGEPILGAHECMQGREKEDADQDN